MWHMLGLFYTLSLSLMLYLCICVRICLCLYRLHMKPGVVPSQRCKICIMYVIMLTDLPTGRPTDQQGKYRAICLWKMEGPSFAISAAGAKNSTGHASCILDLWMSRDGPAYAAMQIDANMVPCRMPFGCKNLKLDRGPR